MPKADSPPSWPTRIAWASTRRGTARAMWSKRIERTGLRENGDFLPLDQPEVDRGAEAGAVHRVHEPAPIDLDVFHEAVLLRRGGQEHLEELAVPDRHDHVQVRHVVQRVAA